MVRDSEEQPVTTPTPPGERLNTPFDASQGEGSVTLSAEQLVTATEWIESGQVRLRRRVVSESRMVEVVVRREELIVEVRNAAVGQVGESYVGTALDGPPVPPPLPRGAPRVILLHEEVPEIVMRPRVYERVTVDVVMSEEVAVWHDTVRHEYADTETTSTSGSSGPTP